MTTEMIRSGFALLIAVSDTIRDLGNVPAGTLYAHLMDRMDLASFDAMILTLVNAGLVVRNPSHLLRWVGPKVN
jgi:hypothetical protein